MSEPTADQLRAKVFEDRETPGDWRVEKLNADGGYDAVKVFTGPDAWLQAIRYAIGRSAAHSALSDAASAEP